MIVIRALFSKYLCSNLHILSCSKTAVDKVLSEGKICVLDIDTQGVRQIKSKPDLESVFVFIKPPSLGVLERRLRDRKTETEENIQRRLKVAEAELEYGTSFIIKSYALQYSSFSLFLKPQSF